MIIAFWKYTVFDLFNAPGGVTFPKRGEIIRTHIYYLKHAYYCIAYWPVSPLSAVTSSTDENRHLSTLNLFLVFYCGFRRKVLNKFEKK